MANGQLCNVCGNPYGNGFCPTCATEIKNWRASNEVGIPSDMAVCLSEDDFDAGPKPQLRRVKCPKCQAPVIEAKVVTSLRGAIIIQDHQPCGAFERE